MSSSAQLNSSAVPCRLSRTFVDELPALFREAAWALADKGQLIIVDDALSRQPVR